MTDAHDERIPQERAFSPADLARHADPKRRSADWSGFEALPPFIGDILHGSDDAREALLSLLTLRTDVKESKVVYERQQREVAADQVSLVQAAIRRGLKLDENAPVGDEERMRVTRLGLINRPVDDDGLRLLVGMSALEHLDLEGTNVTNGGLAHLELLKALRILDLRKTQVADAGLAHLTKLASLQDLWLDHTKVADAGLAHLTKLAKLQVLSLTNTKVADAGLAHLTKLTDLQRLWLDGTQVTDAGLAHLTSLANLRTLWLNRTRVTDAGVAKLKEALPNCDILHR